MASAASEKNIAKAKKQAAKDALIDKTVVVALMQTPDGRRWIWNKLGEARIFHEDETLDHAILAYRQGQRNLGLRLLMSVTANAPDMYVRMTQENTGVTFSNPSEDSSEEETEEQEP